MTASPPPGWYPDPEREGSSRWWDGSAWGAPQEPSAPSGAQPSAGSAEQHGNAFAPYGTDTASASSAAQAQGGYSNPQDAYGAQQSGYSTPQSAYGAQPGYGAPQSAYGAQPGYGGQQNPYAQAPTQQNPAWDAEQPKSSSNTIAFVIIGVVALLLIGALVWLAFIIAGLASDSDSGAAPGPAPTTASDPATTDDETTDETPGTSTNEPGEGEVIDTTSISVAEGSDETSEYAFTIAEAGLYAIHVNNTNGEDPRAELQGPGGFSVIDDDGGPGLDSLIVEQLEAGDYTLVVDEYWGDYLEADIIIERL